MAGLLNVVPRYLPRYGMAPEWVGTYRKAAGLDLHRDRVRHYDTLRGRRGCPGLCLRHGRPSDNGVCRLRRDAFRALEKNSLTATLAFALVTLIFAYTLVANIIERPDGIKIASFFIAAIVVVSLVSRVSARSSCARSA